MGFFDNYRDGSVQSEIVGVNAFAEEQLNQHGRVVFGYIKNAEDLYGLQITSVDFETAAERSLQIVKNATGFSALSEPKLMDCNGVPCDHSKEVNSAVPDNELGKATNEAEVVQIAAKYGITPGNNLDIFKINAIASNLFPIYCYFQIISSKQEEKDSDRDYWNEMRQQAMSKPKNNQAKAKIEKFTSRNHPEEFILGNLQVNIILEISGTKNDAELARKIGVSRAAVGQWRNRASGLSDKKLNEIADKLSLSVDAIMSALKTCIG